MSTYNKKFIIPKSISDVSWSSFITKLTYKTEWKGKNLLKIGRFEPSSKKCSSCGHIKKDLTLKNRTWVCVECGIIHDRDINAAINIKNIALKQLPMEHRLMDVEVGSMDWTARRAKKEYPIDESLKVRLALNLVPSNDTS